ncbi:hypothetical protein ABVT39_015468 [Epinephelus coioides]
MRAISVFLVLVVCVCRGALGVQVKVGDKSFPFEAVKQLKELLDLDKNVSPHLSETSIAACLSSSLRMLVKYVPTPPALGVGTEAAICSTHKHIDQEPPGLSPSIVPAHLYV